MAYIGLVGAVDCDCRSVAFSASSENGLSRSQWVVISNKAQLLFIPFSQPVPAEMKQHELEKLTILKTILCIYIYINMNICTRHYGYMCICITLHYTTSHYIALHCIASHCIALRYMSLHFIALHCITLQCIASHCIALRYMSLHFIALHCITLQCITLQCICICIAFHVITFHCVTLQYVAVHSIALHYIASHCI